MGYVILLWHSLSLPYNYFDFKPSYMLANHNLINGEISCLFVAYMESCLLWTRELSSYFKSSDTFNGKENGSYRGFGY